MADQKISALPTDSSLDSTHYVPLVDPVGPTTKRTLLSTLAAWFFDQLNIPAGSGSPVTRASENMFNYVASGLIWSGDAYASTRNASMTSGVVYINGRRILISAVTARSFTASKDTYIDVLDNANGTGTIVYTEVTNNAASPSLAANSIRIGIIVTGASNIAAAGSVNQGQEDKILPIASSVAYAVTDSLGNLICNRSPNPTLIGFRRITSSFATAATSQTQITGLSCPVIIPTGRKIRVKGWFGTWSNSGSPAFGHFNIWEGTVGSGTQLTSLFTGFQTNLNPFAAVEAVYTPTASSKTYNLGFDVNGGTGTIVAGASVPAFISVELVQ